MYHLSRWTMVLSKSDQWGLPRDKHFKNYINWSNAKRSFKNYYDKNLRFEQFLIPEISNPKCWQSLWKTYRGLSRFYTLDHLKIYSKEGKKRVFEWPKLGFECTEKKLPSICFDPNRCQLANEDFQCVQDSAVPTTIQVRPCLFIQI